MTHYTVSFTLCCALVMPPSLETARPLLDPVPLYTCRRASGPIRIDGKLDEPAWERAEPITLVRTDSGAPTRYRTTARMLWDDQSLYIGFHCEDPDIWGTITARDGHIYTEEVVEVFIDEDGDGISYIEYEVNPRNIALDLYVWNREEEGRSRRLFAWDSDGLLRAVTVDGTVHDRTDIDRSWTVEIALPWGDFMTAPHLPPHDGDRWRINLYRIDRAKDGDELSAWSPTGARNYHIPSRFGEVVFRRE